MLKLEKNTSYINNGNLFSKSLILKENQKKEKTLFIVQNQNDLNNYIKIFDFLNIQYQVIDSQANLIDLLFNKTGFYIINSEILEINIDKTNQLKHNNLEFKVTETINYEDTIKKLNTLNYSFSEYQNPASYHKKGDILNIYSKDNKKQYSISFWGDTIEEIIQTTKVGEIRKDIIKLDNLYIGKADNIAENLKTNYSILDSILDNDFLIILDNLDFYKHYEKITKKAKDVISFDYLENKNLIIKNLDITNPKITNSLELKNILNSNQQVNIFTKNIRTIQNFINFNDIKNTKSTETKLNNIKSFKYKNSIYICDDILNQVFTKKRIKTKLSSNLDLLLKIKPGDYVVHIDHGIGIFNQIIKKTIQVPVPKVLGSNSITKEYLEILYEKNDKLFVPITEVGRVNKYVGIENPKLNSLGTNTWEKKVTKAKQEAGEIAQELIELYAQRKLQKTYAFKDFEKQQDNFKNNFSYIHTPDQDQTIKEILNDLSLEKPMDRLLIGDVGFGKTEVAFNAIYKTFLNKKQSIFIAPLIVLSYQHYNKSLERFKNLGIKIAVLTKLENPKQEQEIKNKLATGEIDLIIGTHKLLSDKIIFKDLGLIIIDEEHKFGVADKEKIKNFKANIHSLAMSATPIPRSLNMALSKLREISILKTAPVNRQNISTIINKYEENIIKEAGTREFERGGQMFFVHNRVVNIENYKTILQKIFPDKKIIVAHGQMSGIELEKRIIAFQNKKYDILVSTTVIENGIDLSNVNTIIINDAPHFGLSQIHQLRGRVGRSEKKGYCYLLYKNENLKPETIKRLKTIVEFSYLGAGFELAMKDLEIRGGGDLLGFKQSGQSNQIGVNLFLKLIEEKIEFLQNNNENKSKETKNNIDTRIDINIDLDIDNKFFNNEIDKLNFFREIENIESIEQLEEIKQNFIDINGELNQGLNNLFLLLEIKINSSKYKIINIKKIGINYQLDFDKSIKIEELKNFIDLDKQVKFVVITKTRLRTSTKNFENPKKFLEYLSNIFNKKVGKRKIIRKGTSTYSKKQ